MSRYITTPIFYVNAEPHLGHAYTAIVADTLSRFARLDGEDVFFQTGTDEHGDKIAQAASMFNETPKAYADRISDCFRAAWPCLLVEADKFIRTTEEEHIKVVQSILQQVYEQGDIYFSDYSGLYCKGCERFVTEKELLADGKCPDHQSPPEEIKEQNYFFKMSRYQDWLIEHIKNNPDFISPERYKNEVLAFLSEPLDDLCISRPISRLDWGIKLPFDERFVTYVWFDALINYISGIGYPNSPGFQQRWAGAEHIIAKDILKPHAVFWPTMLKAIGLPPYRRLLVHGYWNVNDTKMSKSIGNVVKPAQMVADYGADTVRYFLLREMSFGLDASYSHQSVLARRNSDLANDLGNLFSRSLTMVKNFSAARVPQPGKLAAEDQELADACVAMLAEYRQRMRDYQFRQALESAWELVGRANRYIVTNAPWELAKSAEKKERLDTVLYTLLETLRFIACVLRPVMPESAEKMMKMLSLAPGIPFSEHQRWGLLEPGSEINTGDNLFPRIKIKKGK